MDSISQIELGNQDLINLALLTAPSLGRILPKLFSPHIS